MFWMQWMLRGTYTMYIMQWGMLEMKAGGCWSWVDAGDAEWFQQLHHITSHEDWLWWWSVVCYTQWIYTPYPVPQQTGIWPCSTRPAQQKHMFFLITCSNLSYKGVVIIEEGSKLGVQGKEPVNTLCLFQWHNILGECRGGGKSRVPITAEKT